MSIMYVGDTHGILDVFINIDRYAIQHGIEHVVQVGDCGIAFEKGVNCPVMRFFNKRDRQGRPGPTWWTAGGNHDNYDWWDQRHLDQGSPDIVEMTPGFNWVTRGSSALIDGKSHLFCGGAESTDQHHRVEGVSWWRRETPSYAEFDKFAQALSTGNHEVIITHDAPLRVPVGRWNRDEKATPNGLEGALATSGVVPPLWVFGHFHECQEWHIEGTRFICCGFNGDYWYNDKFHVETKVSKFRRG